MLCNPREGHHPGSQACVFFHNWSPKVSEISGSMKTVGDLRRLLGDVPDDVPLHAGSACYPRVTVYYTESPRRAMQVDFSVGEEA